MTRPENWQCAAYGCPLPGGQSNEIGPGVKYYCRFHIGSPREKWDAISFRINQNMDRLSDLYPLHNAPFDKSHSRYIDPEKKSANPELSEAA